MEPTALNKKRVVKKLNGFDTSLALTRLILKILIKIYIEILCCHCFLNLSDVIVFNQRWIDDSHETSFR